MKQKVQQNNETRQNHPSPAKRYLRSK